MDDQWLETFRADVSRRFDSVAELISQVVERIDARIDALERRMEQRFETIEQRFEAMDRRIDRIGDQLAGVNQQLAALTRWSDRTDRDSSALLATQAAQQRAIDDLAARVAKLEQRHGGLPPASPTQR